VLVVCAETELGDVCRPCAGWRRRLVAGRRAGGGGAWSPNPGRLGMVHVGSDEGAADPGDLVNLTREKSMHGVSKTNNM
jgi:hypothetical protein